MKRALFLLALIALPCFAELQEVNPVTVPMTNRILFVIDVSGSMQGTAFAVARQTLLELAGVPTDDLEFGIIAFSDRTTRWPGLPNEHTPEGWAQLPSNDALDSAQLWLSSQQTSGDTSGTAALTRAFNEQHNGLTIIMITDGKFNGVGDAYISTAPTRLNALREQDGFDRASFVVIGVGTICASYEHLRQLGSTGFYVAPLAN